MSGDEKMTGAAKQFRLEGDPVSCEPYGKGHINRTCLLVTDAPHRYILQRISREAFHDIPALMENISRVTQFLAEKTDDPRASLHLIPTLDGHSFYQDQDGECWRVYDFVEDSFCLQAAQTPGDFYQSAVAFGNFQNMLREFPAAELHETIPDFHNTPDRYRKFDLACEADLMGRAAGAAREIEFALSRRKDAGVLQLQRENGSLPLRVTHNDTKLNNVLFDAKSRRALCVIDLDTVMPGLAAYDFGDSIRFGASTAAEDEKDLDRVWMDTALFRTYVKGFVPACGGLTEAELHSLPCGAWMITLECGLRFLTDYLNGDTYFSTAYPEHNLVRARNQFKLVKDMEEKWEAMQEIVASVNEWDLIPVMHTDGAAKMLHTGY